ncbi:hypothetical protein Y10_24060 [Neptunitalea sp. Y10]|uniref:Uncharacterized protein n=2 Tax=Neptunitalea lumnitzerae TaxID=2965509 RepID=A0ABQ5MKU6_9FLAO|nr:hypothetical protein Y10_24060 [Neptunitalea sp. Y10]
MITVPKVFYNRYVKAVDSLYDLMKNYPGIQMGHHLITHLEEMRRRVVSPDALPAEIIFLDTPSFDDLKKIVKFLGVNEVLVEDIQIAITNAKTRYSYETLVNFTGVNLRLKFYNSAHLPIRSTAAIQPVFKLAFWLSDEAPGSGEFETIALRLQSEGGILFFINTSENQFLKTSGELKVLPTSYKNMPESIEVLLASKGITSMLPIFYGARLLQGLEKISDAFYQYVVQQEKDIKTKKFNAQQDINQVKQDEQLNFRELYQGIKKNLQRDFSEFERGVNDAVIKMNQSRQENSLMYKVSTEIDEIATLEEQVIAGKLKMSLPEEKLTHVSQMIATGIRNQMDQDVFSLKEFLNQEIEDCKKKLEQYHIEFSYSPNIQFNLSRVEANIVEYNQFVQRYETDKKNLETGDYIRAALKPFMTVFSLMMILRFVPSLRKSVGEYIPYIGLALAPFAIYTFYKFLKHTKEQKELDYKNELNRMRDTLYKESKSIVKKLGDEWLRELVSTLRDELNEFIGELEHTFSVASDEHKTKIQDSQRAVQRRIQGLEQRDRAHQSTLKGKDSFDKLLAQFKGELIQQYHETISKL